MPYNKQTGKGSYKWAFPEDVSDVHIKMQVISDIYKAIQTRLDGYRQKAGTIFLAVFASAVTLDSTFIQLSLRIYLDKDVITSKNKIITYYVLMAFCAFAIIIVCLAAFLIIRSISGNFGEMTSIIYKIDCANEVWTKSRWLENETLYPPKFEEAVDVRTSETDPPLPGWKDPAISHYEWLIVIIGILHLGFFLAVYISLR